jgi:hypothetical protein
MYFFHYTSEDNHQTMTLETPWNCEARQPQKGAWYSDQHEVGFYVTPLAPSQLTETKARKTGGGGKSGEYVLVFNLDVRAKDFNGTGSSVNLPQNIRIKLVGQPVKFALTPFGKDPEGKRVPFAQAMCAWSGPVEDCPAQFANDEKVIKSLYS